MTTEQIQQSAGTTPAPTQPAPSPQPERAEDMPVTNAPTQGSTYGDEVPYDDEG